MQPFQSAKICSVDCRIIRCLSSEFGVFGFYHLLPAEKTHDLYESYTSVSLSEKWTTIQVLKNLSLLPIFELHYRTLKTPTPENGDQRRKSTYHIVIRIESPLCSSYNSNFYMHVFSLIITITIEGTDCLYF